MKKKREKHLAKCSFWQWRIYIQKFLACAPPPTGPNSFIFTYVFTEKHLCRRLAPPPMRVGAPPTGNPGSAPVLGVVIVTKWHDSHSSFSICKKISWCNVIQQTIVLPKCNFPFCLDGRLSLVELYNLPTWKSIC